MRITILNDLTYAKTEALNLCLGLTFLSENHNLVAQDLE